MSMGVCRIIKNPLSTGILIVAMASLVFSSIAGAQRPPGDPSYGARNPDAVSFMNVSPEDDTMFYMLNLMKYREKAEYDDGRETTLTGQEAAGLYDPLPEVRKVGGGIVYAGSVDEQLAGKDPTWDTVGIVMYPSRRKLIEMSTSSTFGKTVPHKGASLAVSQIMVTIPEPWKLSDKPPLATKDVPYPATAEDQTVTLFHLVKYRDVAQYAAGSNDPKRTGREAMAFFDESVKELLYEIGATPMLKAQVQGVLVGDGRKWSEYRILRFPSHRAMQEVQKTIGERNLAHHHAAAVEDEYTLMLTDRIDLTANPPTPGATGQTTGSQSFDSSQAPIILSSLDADKDGKISLSEAVEDMKANFAMIDSNGDGGIDIDELTRILKMQSSR